MKDLWNDSQNHFKNIGQIKNEKTIKDLCTIHIELLLSIPWVKTSIKFNNWMSPIHLKERKYLLSCCSNIENGFLITMDDTKRLENISGGKFYISQ